MANPRKKIINQWDGGIKSHPRDNNPDTSDGAQMVKGFDIYKDPRKLSPMQSWTSFTTDAEKAYGIRAMGGISDTVYGTGKALDSWYGKSWNYRIKIDVSLQHHKASIPLRIDMSTLGNDFWSHANADMSDVRATTRDGKTPVSVFCENIDTVNKTGDMWVEASAVDVGTVAENTLVDFNGTGTQFDATNSGAEYAFAIPVDLVGQTFNALKINLKKTISGTFANTDIICDLYTDNAGVPGTKVQELGRIDIDTVDSITRDYIIACDDITLTGTYHIVFYNVTASGGYISYTYQNSGTQTVNKATNSGRTTWASIDTSATPNLELINITNSGFTDKYFYIYYGYSGVNQVPYGTPVFDYRDSGRTPFTDNSCRFWYTFADEYVGNNYYTSPVSAGGTEAFTTDPQAFISGYWGKAIETYGTTIQTDQDDEVALTADSVSFGFFIKISAGEAKTFLQDANGDWTIALDLNRKIVATINGSVATTACTSTIALSVDQWHYVQVTYDDDCNIYIDGVKESFNINDGTFADTPTSNKVVVNTGTGIKLAQISGFNTLFTDAQIYTRFQNFLNPYFYTVNSEVAQTSLEPSYLGTQLYSKSISSGSWEEYLQNGRPVRSLDVSPVNAFVDDTGTYFITSQSPENQGFMFLSRVDAQDVLDTSHLLLTVGSLLDNSRIIPQPENAMDANTYFNYGLSTIGKVGDPGSASAFTASTSPQSLGAWRDYLALGGTRRNRGYINIWDLALTQSTEKVDVGNGNVRIVGSAGDTLFCVVDNFIDDAVKSANKPTMEIKQYVGNGRMETTHILEIPTNIATTTYSDTWDFAVSNMKIQRNTQILFYARLPKDSTGTTFNEGLWTVGKNTRGQLALTLQIDTEGLGMPENIFAFAQQVFFIQKDGGIKRLSEDTYDNVALYTTLKMNEGNTQIEKKLIGIEIVTEPLEAGQTVSVYFKKNGDTSRTKIFDMTGENEITYETTYDINEDNLPIYKEIEFDIESTGGTASILELNYRYEYLSEIV